MNTNLQETITFVESAHFAIASENNPRQFPEHWHTSAEFILATKNNCIYSINGDTYKLDAGEILLIWPTELHSVISTPEESSLILQFNADLITGCRDFNIYYHTMRNIHCLTHLSRELNHRFCEYMTQINHLYGNEQPFAEPKIMIIIYEMLLALCQHFQDNNMQQISAPGIESHTFYMVKHACTYINDNCKKDISQTDVAEYCGFSTFYFSRIFKQYTGESFPEYLTKKRIAASTDLLLTDSLSITDVAYQSGFQSISNFNKIFKKHMGCTPMQYRKLHGGDRNF